MLLAVVFGALRQVSMLRAGLLAVGATGYGLSLRFYLLAQRSFEATRTGSVFAFAPFVGALFGVVLGVRAGSEWMLGGAFLIILGLVLHLAETHAHEHAHTHGDGHHVDTHELMHPGLHSHVHLHIRIRHSDRH